MTRKLDKEHQDAIQLLQREYDEITIRLGQLTIEENYLHAQIASIATEKTKLFDKFSANQTRETELIDSMRDRYGEGQINIADGTFTPTTTV